MKFYENRSNVSDFRQTSDTFDHWRSKCSNVSDLMKINDNDNQRKSNEHQWKSDENLWNSRLLIHSTTHILHILWHIITYYHILQHFSTDYHILTNMVAYYYIFPPITTYFHILQHSHRLSALPVQCRDRFFDKGLQGSKLTREIPR